MRGSMLPTSPFIHYYDDECDLKRRANRLKKKIAELQEAGLLPVQPETARQEEKQGRQSCKRKPWEEHRKRNKDEYRKKKSSSQADKQRAKRHRSDAERDHKMEDDFPRGYHKHTSQGSKKHHKSILQAHSSKKEYGQQLLEAAKRKKKRKKQRDASPDMSDNLFLIKQRRKKSKQKSFCW
ncbi:UNVERIFIED_CONTAM: hypothetical protein H355_015321 [Colinus virginianus]|nr:hypothetical protein H355_015321 [Colinus virginianus]